ncbi:CocE/NonD family hydrolase C-terminal non-catalytic domain-containing protein [Steroidobacter sp.]|uniref:CocE/NonD family hydrolase C-terminal non-catalytic domain-containing protein n=1 Tax=Steroidobacter sp. TaxID=1978227 RepID=UPI0039F498E9
MKLIDVHPADGVAGKSTEDVMLGYQQLVRGAITRGKFRDSLEHPKAMSSGQVTRVDVSLPDAYHTFRRGHRIMVQVQSSWFPLFDRNPQTFVDIYQATAGDFRRATHRVCHSSTIELSVLLAMDISSDQAR